MPEVRRERQNPRLTWHFGSVARRSTLSERQDTGAVSNTRVKEGILGDDGETAGISADVAEFYRGESKEAVEKILSRMTVAERALVAWLARPRRFKDGRE